ncbi:DinB family protein [Pseudonocardia sp. TRM90224]|uniref:DinB family protein n=1 Tax=Pseudonocardia sp. TRM90224 TaxID=2812678 RepID=UPI001E3AA332|nr:DinB family protein [Pseudonocardia sp. TRM90224]
MTDDPRPQIPPFGDERTILAAYLDWHRATIALKCAGLTPAQLASRPLPPSTMSLLGLIRHLTDVERGWFGRVIAGQDLQPIYYSDADPDGDFDNVDEATVDQSHVDATFAAWHAQREQSRAIADGVGSLDEIRPHRREGDLSVRWILVHLLEEYARHSGHADLMREQIDGVTGE